MQVLLLRPRVYLLTGDQQQGPLTVTCNDSQSQEFLQRAVALTHAAGQQGNNAVGGHSSAFEAKTDQGSAQVYFKYYGSIQHQQNMLQARVGQIAGKRGK
jgi:hypothetical protein